MSLENMLIVGAILFAIGLYGALARRNVLVVLMSIELMFNGVNLTLVAFAKYVAPAGLAENFTQNIGGVLTGQVFAVFVITVAAAEITGADGERFMPDAFEDVSTKEAARLILAALREAQETQEQMR